MNLFNAKYYFFRTSCRLMLCFLLFGAIYTCLGQCENASFEAPYLSQIKIDSLKRENNYYTVMLGRLSKYIPQSKSIYYLNASKTHSICINPITNDIEYKQNVDAYVLYHQDTAKKEIVLSFKVSADSQKVGIWVTAKKDSSYRIYVYEVRNTTTILTPIDTLRSETIEDYYWDKASKGIYYATRNEKTDFLGEIRYHHIKRNRADSVIYPTPSTEKDSITNFYLTDDYLVLMQYEKVYSHSLKYRKLKDTTFISTINKSEIIFLGIQDAKLLATYDDILILRHLDTGMKDTLFKKALSSPILDRNSLLFLEKKDSLYCIGFIENVYENDKIRYLFTSKERLFDLACKAGKVQYSQGTPFQYNRYECVLSSPYLPKLINTFHFEMDTITTKDGHHLYLHPKVKAQYDRKRAKNKNAALPTLVYVYGGFDTDVMTQADVCLLAWLEAGGLLYIPNIPTHHKGGQKLQTIENVQNAALSLIKLDYTDSAHLAIYGASHGGWLAAQVAICRPTLWKACIMEKGLSDLCMSPIWDEYGQQWVGEFGVNEDTLKLLSPSHNLKNNTKYPAFLMITGKYDRRVSPYHSYLLKTELEALPSKPETWLYEEEMEHEEHSNTVKMERYALIYTFLREYIGFDDKWLEMNRGVPSLLNK